MSVAQRRGMVDREHLSLLIASLSIARQCALLGVARSSLYYRPKEASGEDLALLRAIYRGPRTSLPAPAHRAYPYLLEKITVTRSNQVWAADITYLPMARGLLYLVAIMDWHSRYVVAWRLSNTLEADCCVDALQEGLEQGQPEIFNTDQGNTDQGSQFTSLEFTQVLQEHGVKISRDGKGRYSDNIFVERLWRTLKYEEEYLKAYANATEARKEVGAYFRFYNDQRPHQALGYRTPAEMFHGATDAPVEESKEGRNSTERVLVSLPGAPGLSLDSPSIRSN